MYSSFVEFTKIGGGGIFTTIVNTVNKNKLCIKICCVSLFTARDVLSIVKKKIYKLVIFAFDCNFKAISGWESSTIRQVGWSSCFLTTQSIYLLV